jgi:hypothetical protein
LWQRLRLRRLRRLRLLYFVGSVPRLLDTPALSNDVDPRRLLWPDLTRLDPANLRCLGGTAHVNPWAVLRLRVLILSVLILTILIPTILRITALLAADFIACLSIAC